ncbi:MAG: hypothetical protein ACI8YI_001435, partial [Paracoccaceae bacterium]
FELDGRQHPVPSVFAFRIVEHFDIVEHIAPCIFSGFVCSPPNALPFQQVEEAFGNGVVVEISATAHTVFQMMML